MNYRRPTLGLGWILGMIQYSVCLAGGGALWILLALGTGFFWGDLLAQACASLFLLALVVAETGWIHVPTRNEHMGDYIADFLSSGAIVGFGMGITLFIGLSLSH
jgi:hypothetical protein